LRGLGTQEAKVSINSPEHTKETDTKDKYCGAKSPRVCSFERNGKGNTMSDAKLVRGNYLKITFGYDCEALVPANAKTIEAFNLLFGPDTMVGRVGYVTISNDESGETNAYRWQEGKSERVACTVMQWAQVAELFLPYIKE
jgi:hypothetical protein